MTVFSFITNRVLRKKLIFTVAVIAVAEFLTHFPVFGVDPAYMEQYFGNADILGFMDSLSGGALTNLTFGSFGVTSYITASIIIQLLTMVIPRLERLRKDGEYGRKKFQKAEFVLSLAITVLSSIALAYFLGDQGAFRPGQAASRILPVACWILGGTLIVVLEKMVEKHGIGNGISLILTFNILSRVPGSLYSFYTDAVSGEHGTIAVLPILLALAFFFAVFLATVYLQCGELRIPVRQIRKTPSAFNDTPYIPVSVNISSVLPVVYASAVISMPSVAAAILDIDPGSVAGKIIFVFTPGQWYTGGSHWYLAGIAAYLFLMAVFGVFASSMTFNAAEVADNMKRNGNIIDGVKPGEMTARFLDQRRKTMAAMNVTFLAVLATVPDALCAAAGISRFNFLGTSLIIVIAMFYDTALRAKGEYYRHGTIAGIFEQEGI